MFTEILLISEALADSNVNDDPKEHHVLFEILNSALLIAVFMDQAFVSRGAPFPKLLINHMITAKTLWCPSLNYFQKKCID